MSWTFWTQVLALLMALLMRGAAGDPFRPSYLMMQLDSLVVGWSWQCWILSPSAREARPW